MLTTVRDDGTLHTRPMLTRFNEPMGDLWFFTTEHARKSDEVRHEHQVAVAFADPQRNIYASVTGSATVEHDRQSMSRLWAPQLMAWLPRGPDDPELALLRVRVRSAEYWDAPSSTMIEIIAAVQAGLESSSPAVAGEHEEVNLRQGRRR